MTESPNGQLKIVQAMAAVMADVRKVTKTDFNQQQNYSFRGVDRVVNAVAQPLREHGVLVLPELLEERLQAFETGNKKTMWRSVVKVRYRFIGPTGDELAATVAGEGSDSLDKATSKAMSVAYRTALLQALCLPTSDPDPDSFTPPPAMPEGVGQTKLAQAKTRVWEHAKSVGWDVDTLGTKFTEQFGKPIGDSTTGEMETFAKTLTGEETPKATRTVTRAPKTDEEKAFTRLHILWTELGMDRDAYLMWSDEKLDRDSPLESSKDLTAAEVAALIPKAEAEKKERGIEG